MKKYFISLFLIYSAFFIHKGSSYGVSMQDRTLPYVTEFIKQKLHKPYDQKLIKFLNLTISRFLKIHSELKEYYQALEASQNPQWEKEVKPIIEKTEQESKNLREEVHAAYLQVVELESSPETQKTIEDYLTKLIKIHSIKISELEKEIQTSFFKIGF